jgi:preprotein translocase subunit Sec61beta
MLASKNAMVIYLGILIFLNSWFFNQLKINNSWVWYVAIALNLMLIVAMTRWIRKRDE